MKNYVEMVIGLLGYYSNYGRHLIAGRHTIRD